MRRFTEEEKATIWEDHQAGVPLKRIARNAWQGEQCDPGVRRAHRWHPAPAAGRL